MPRLVDGDNLLGTWPGRSRSQDDKRKLAREIDAFTRRERRACLLVFDGARPEGVGFAAETIFSGPGRSADALIVARVRESGDPRGCVVVTADRALADRCRTLGARIESPRAFRALEAFGGEPSAE
jgi:predicted RNA-binding protein with PIN domain